MTLRTVAGLALASILLAGCSSPTGEDDAPTTAASPSPSASPTPTTPATTAPTTEAAPKPAITPEPRRAPEDQVTYGDRECHQGKASSTVLTCTFGDPEGDVTIVAVGDSKTEQYLSVLDAVGKERGWRVIGMTKSACAFSTAQLTGGSQPNKTWRNCEQWNRKALRKIEQLQPDAVLTALYKLKVPKFGRSLSSVDQKTLMAEGIHDALARTGVPSVVLRATPRAQSGDDIAQCVARHPKDTSRCDITGDTVTDPELVWSRTAMGLILDDLDEATSMSINNLICSSERRCEAVADGILRYRDSHHLTETFLLSVADAFGARLERALVRVGVLS